MSVCHVNAGGVDKTYLHYRVGGSSGFYTMCGRDIGEIGYWVYYAMRYNAPDDLPLCTECEDWSNLVELAEAEI